MVWTTNSAWKRRLPATRTRTRPRPGFRRTCATHWPCGATVHWRGTHSATRSSRTTQTPRPSSSPPSTRRSPTGSCSAASSDCSHLYSEGRNVKHDVINPATEDVVASIQLADEREADAAIERARGAFASWRRLAPGDPADLL